MAVIAGNRLGIELCEVLGIKPEEVYHFKLDIESSCIAEVTIHRYITNDEGERINQILERYKAIPL